MYNCTYVLYNVRLQLYRIHILFVVYSYVRMGITAWCHYIEMIFLGIALGRFRKYKHIDGVGRVQ